MRLISRTSMNASMWLRAMPPEPSIPTTWESWRLMSLVPIAPSGNDHLMALQVLEAVVGRRMPREDDRHLLRRTADPVQFQSVEADALGIEQRLHRQAAGEKRDLRAVLRCLVVNVVGRRKAARSGHVLDDDRGTARKCLGQLPRD